MKLRYLLLVLGLWATVFANALTAQPQDNLKRCAVVEMELLRNANIDLATTNQFAIGLDVYQHNGKHRRTRGLAKGTCSWDRFNIHVFNGRFKDGLVSFDPKEVHANGHVLHITASPKNNPALQQEFEVAIPYLVDFTVQYDAQGYLAPGFAIPLSINAKFSNGKHYSLSNDADSGALSWSDFTIMYPGSADTRSNLAPGYAAMANDRLDIVQELQLAVVFNHNPALIRAMRIPMNYKAPYTLSFEGLDGAPGEHGSDARGVFDDIGKNGERGYSGYNGSRGSNVRLFVQPAVISGDTLLRVLARSPDRTEKLVIDPQGGKLYLDCRGGSGGMGGRGGDGASVGTGIGGDGGNGGQGGNGGRGGKVTIYTDSLGLPYLSAITVLNNGGQAGPGGGGGRCGSGGSDIDYDGHWLAVLLGIIAEAALTSGSDGKDGLAGTPGNNGAKATVRVLSSKKLQRYVRRAEARAN